ncbi:hypothetical protein D3C75_938290 [compost metagenome]
MMHTAASQPFLRQVVAFLQMDLRAGAAFAGFEYNYIRLTGNRGGIAAFAAEPQQIHKHLCGSLGSFDRQMYRAEAEDAVNRRNRAFVPWLTACDPLVMFIRYKDQALSLMIPEGQRLAAAAVLNPVMLHLESHQPLIPIVQRLVVRHAERQRGNAVIAVTVAACIRNLKESNLGAGIACLVPVE